MNNMRKSTRHALISLGVMLVLQVVAIGGYRYWWGSQSLFGALGLIDTNANVAAAMATMQGFQSVILNGPIDVAITRQERYSVRLIPAAGRDRMIGASMVTVADTGRTILFLQARRDIGDSEPVPRVEIGVPALNSVSAGGFRRLRLEGFDQRLQVGAFDAREVVLVNDAAGIDLRVGNLQQLAWDDATAASSKLNHWTGVEPAITRLAQETH